MDQISEQFLGFNISFLLSFPFSLSFVLIALWLYQKYSYYWVSAVLIVVFLANVVLLPQEALSYFWFPGGASTTIIASIITFIYLEFNIKKYKKPLGYFKNMISDRVTLKDSMAQIKDPLTRQKKYFDSINQFSKYFRKTDEAIQYSVSFYYFLCLGLSFAINFGYWLLIYLTDPKVIENFKKNSSENIIRIYKNEIPKEHLDQTIQTIYFDYAPVFTALFNLFTILLLVLIVHQFWKKKHKNTYFLLSINFFKLPPKAILFYIPLLAVLMLRLYVPFLEPYALFLNNLILLFSIFYFLQGVSIVLLYIKVRYLPLGFIMIPTLLICYFIPVVLVLLLFLLFLLGLFEFALDFRKKTLQFE